jgi:hypothetical protein
LQIGCDEAVRWPAAEGERSWTIGDDKRALWILESRFTREGRRCGRIEGGVVRGVRIRRAVDVEARHRGAPPSRVSRDRTGVSVLDRSGRPPAGRVDEADPAIARIRTHPILNRSTRPRHLLRAMPALPGQAAPPARARPRRSSGSPGHQGKLGWSMSYVTMVLDTTSSPKSARGTVTRSWAC